MRVLVLLAVLLLSHTAAALPGNYLAATPGKDDFALVGSNSQALIQLSSSDHKGLLRAVSSLQADIQAAERQPQRGERSADADYRQFGQ